MCVSRGVLLLVGQSCQGESRALDANEAARVVTRREEQKRKLDMYK